MDPSIENDPILNFWYKLLYKELNVINKYRDIRLLTLILHLHSEKVINQLISNRLKNEKRIFNNRSLNTYSCKIDLLDSLGIFKEKETYSNLKTLNKIRNIFVHTIDFDDSLNLVKKEIRKLAKIKSVKNLGKQTEKDFQKVEDYLYFQSRIINTLIALQGLLTKND